MVYLILILFTSFYVALMIWVLSPDYVLCGIVKESERCNRGRSFPKLFNSAELCVLNKIIYNIPVLDENTSSHMQALKSAGFNLSLPIYKINIGGNKSLKALFCELKILKRLEGAGYPTNIVINFDGRGCRGVDNIRENQERPDFGQLMSKSKKFYYNDILIMTAGMNFEKSVVKIHQAEFLGSSLMFAVNAFNINKLCAMSLGGSGAKKNIDERLFDRFGGAVISERGEPQPCGGRLRVWFMAGENIFMDAKEYYDEFAFKSQVSQGDINISRKRTASFKKNYTIERIAISNIGKRAREVLVNMFLPLGTDGAEAGLIKTEPHKGGIKVVDYKSGKTQYFSTSCGLMRNLFVTKLGVSAKMKLKIRGGSVFYVYFINSCDFVTVQNLERGETLFFDAKNEFKGAVPLKVKSNNISFDRLINLLLPQRIISRFIDNPKYMPDFAAFSSLIYEGKNEYVSSLKGMYVKNDNLIDSYFNLLWQFAGVSFARQGVKINLQHRWLLEDVSLRFVAEENSINLKIKKLGVEQGFVYNGVEYYNIGFLPYELLYKNERAVIGM